MKMILEIRGQTSNHYCLSGKSDDRQHSVNDNRIFESTKGGENKNVRAKDKGLYQYISHFHVISIILETC